MRSLVLGVVFGLALVGSRAYADTIAMLPLDGEKRLEIYGQPVAAEIARALKAAGLDVVVVGAKMDVPDTANLIVDGTIKAAKAKQVDVSIRIRDPRDGTTLETLPAPTARLDNLDKTAAELSSRVVPAVKSQLEAIAKKAALTKVEPKPTGEPKPIQPVQPVAPASPTLKTTVNGTNVEPLRAALDREAALWAATQRYSARLELNVLAYKPRKKKQVPLARARVRMTILDDAGKPKLDRVVVTDTIVGDVKSTDGELAARTAREILAIVRPNLERALRQ